MTSRGVDVSHHQPPHLIDWEVLKDEGYSWMIARAAYGTSLDKTFKAHTTNAREAGFKVGGYLFYRHQQPPAEQCRVFVDALEDAQCGSVGDIVPTLDVEYNSYDDAISDMESYRKGAQRICGALAAEYGDAVVYINPAWYVEIGSPEWAMKYPIWVAQYPRNPHRHARPPAWPRDIRCDIWQHTGSGRLRGFPGRDIDLNRVLTELPLISDKPSTPPDNEDYEELSERLRQAAELEDWHEVAITAQRLLDLEEVLRGN